MHPPRLVGVALLLGGSLGVLGVDSPASVASVARDPVGEFFAVSCAGTSYCLAVGTAAASWNGAIWTPLPKPVLPHGFIQEFMNAVSCPQADNCVVVGTYESRTTRRTLADQWNGHRWTVLGTGESTNAELDAVSCPSTSWCMAGGGTYSGGTSKILAGTWSGTVGGEWTPTPITPVGGSSSSSVGAVACASASVCVEVGSGVNVWDGQSWSSIPTSGYDIGAPSCQPDVSASECTYLGAYSSGGKFYSDTVQYTGSSWQLVGATSGSSVLGTANPGAYSCSGPTSCFAVGQQTVSGKPGPTTFTEYWNGETWAAVASLSPNPAPRGSHYDAFFGVSCVSADFCIAVGRANSDLLAERWNGTHWLVGRFG